MDKHVEIDTMRNVCVVLKNTKLLVEAVLCYRKACASVQWFK